MAADTDSTFACYVTVMNKSGVGLENITYTQPYGSFVVVPPTDIQSGQQAYFWMQSGDTSGPEGTVTFQAESGMITVAFACPWAESNSIRVDVNTTDLVIGFYGVTQVIDWDPNGSNWGTENNYPKAGHPLSVLFVVDAPDTAPAGGPT